MKSIAFIGYGAIAGYAVRHIRESGSANIAFAIIRQGSERRAQRVFGTDTPLTYSVDDLPLEPDLILDCAGHGALRQHGEGILASGIDLGSVSSGALADEQLCDRLLDAARRGGSQLKIISGAIGALDALSAAAVGGLDSVTYRGRKPPRGWFGSPAEEKLDLAALSQAATHFSGNARDAALRYPKNANVAASVALAGVGFDRTDVELVADPGVDENIHEIVASGEFGSFEFSVRGRALPDNPRSSALTAMSVVREALNRVAPFIV